MYSTTLVSVFGREEGAGFLIDLIINQIESDAILDFQLLARPPRGEKLLYEEWVLDGPGPPLVIREG